MKRKDFLNKLLSIVPAIAVIGTITTKKDNSIKEINIDKNKNDRLIMSSGCTFINRNCSG